MFSISVLTQGGIGKVVLHQDTCTEILFIHLRYSTNQMFTGDQLSFVIYCKFIYERRSHSPVRMVLDGSVSLSGVSSVFLSVGVVSGTSFLQTTSDI